MARPKRCILSVTVTVLAIVAMELINLGVEFDFTLAPAFVVVVGVAYVSGLYAGLLSSIAVSLYSFYLLGPHPRFAVVTICIFAITVMTGYLKRRARMYDTINGNIKAVQQSLLITRFLRNNWQQINAKTISTNLEQLEDLLGNLASRVIGWHQLRQEMKEVEELYRR